MELLFFEKKKSIEVSSGSEEWEFNIHPLVKKQLRRKMGKRRVFAYSARMTNKTKGVKEF